MTLDAADAKLSTTFNMLGGGNHKERTKVGANGKWFFHKLCMRVHDWDGTEVEQCYKVLSHLPHLSF